MQRRSKGGTFAVPRRQPTYTSRSTIDNVGEISALVNAGVSNLTYYKVDLAIDEFEKALDMLKASR